MHWIFPKPGRKEPSIARTKLTELASTVLMVSLSFYSPKWDFSKAWCKSYEGVLHPGQQSARMAVTLIPSTAHNHKEKSGFTSSNILLLSRWQCSPHNCIPSSGSPHPSFGGLDSVFQVALIKQARRKSLNNNIVIQAHFKSKPVLENTIASVGSLVY